jgi:hypothetical protein
MTPGKAVSDFDTLPSTPGAPNDKSVAEKRKQNLLQGVPFLWGSSEYAKVVPPTPSSLAKAMAKTDAKPMQRCKRSDEHGGGYVYFVPKTVEMGNVSSTEVRNAIHSLRGKKLLNELERMVPGAEELLAWICEKDGTKLPC